MIKKIVFISFVFLIFQITVINASTKNNIIKNLSNTRNLSFEFKQNINNDSEQGNCVIEYPKKIYCKYKNNNKILVSNGKNLVIKNLKSNQYYIYPINKTAFNLILDKKFIIGKMKNNNGELIDDKYYRFKFIEGDYQINIFFDKNSYNIIGWQNIDIYKNLVITYLFNLKKNIIVENNKFKLPSKFNN